MSKSLLKKKEIAIALQKLKKLVFIKTMFTWFMLQLLSGKAKQYSFRSDPSSLCNIILDNFKHNFLSFKVVILIYYTENANKF